MGLDPDYVASTGSVLPATRFAVDAYVRFVREEPLLPKVAASLTELFAPQIHKDRVAGLLVHYDFANADTLSFFQYRLIKTPNLSPPFACLRFRGARLPQFLCSMCATWSRKSDRGL